jgi:2-(1,2-epoxy-1,2-dihydrophenyl)acetyl-CoA isomerase
MADERPLEEQVTWRVTDGVAWITIDAPDQGNSLTMAMRDRLGDLFVEASGALEVRAVVLTGAGPRHFCTGANLGGPRPPAPARPEGAPDRAMGDASRLIRSGWQRLISTVLDCEKPVIGAINGTAAGGAPSLRSPDLVIFARAWRCSCGAASCPTPVAPPASAHRPAPGQGAAVPR